MLKEMGGLEDVKRMGRWKKRSRGTSGHACVREEVGRD
jgi:hypothetical protein